MARKKGFSAVKPRLMISKRGKIGLRGPLFRLGGLNLSRSGVSFTQKVGGGSINTRTGLSVPLGQVFSTSESSGSGSDPQEPQLILQGKKPGPPLWALILGAAVGLTCISLVLFFLFVAIVGSSDPTPTPAVRLQETPILEGLTTETQAIAPTETLAPSATTTQAIAPTRTIFISATPFETLAPVCDCYGPDLNCDDFVSSHDAQTCFDYCNSIGQDDTFRLDGDGDGVACQN